MSDVTVRPAIIADEPAIVRLISQMRALEGLSAELPQGGVASYLALDDTHLLLAEKDGEVVGLVSIAAVRDLFHCAENGFVQELIVDDAYRRQGVGAALLDAAIEWAQARGCVEVCLVTGEGNVAARALYESRGLTTEGVYLERHLG